jgi:dipeptidyl aminopeptidase/acylaminoacyl peptidase
MISSLAYLLVAGLGLGDIHEHPAGKELPHDKYVHVVSEQDSPVQQLFVKTKDGLYVAAALRKPKGDGPFPALVYFHGAPGGRGMEKLVSWSRGDTGGPLWERFLQEGFVVVVADYRAIDFKRMAEPISGASVSYVDDGVALVEYVKGLPYVDKGNVSVYGVSLGGNLVLHLIGRTKVRAAILGAPAPFEFLGGQLPEPRGVGLAERFKNLAAIPERALRNVEAIQCPVLIFVGTDDPLQYLARPLHDLMERAGKSVRLEIYAKGYHDFVAGPQGQPGRAEPLLESTLDALEQSVKFLKGTPR